MTLEWALIALSWLLSGVAIGIAAYIWCRLRRLEGDIYHTDWNIDAVLARLDRYGEQGH